MARTSKPNYHRTETDGSCYDCNYRAGIGHSGLTGPPVNLEDECPILHPAVTGRSNSSWYMPLTSDERSELFTMLVEGMKNADKLAKVIYPLDYEQGKRWTDIGSEIFDLTCGLAAA